MAEKKGRVARLNQEFEALDLDGISPLALAMAGMARQDRRGDSFFARAIALDWQDIHADVAAIQAQLAVTPSDSRTEIFHASVMQLLEDYGPNGIAMFAYDMTPQGSKRYHDYGGINFDIEVGPADERILESVNGNVASSTSMIGHDGSGSPQTCTVWAKVGFDGKLVTLTPIPHESRDGRWMDDPKWGAAWMGGWEESANHTFTPEKASPHEMIQVKARGDMISVQDVVRFSNPKTGNFTYWSTPINTALFVREDRTSRGDSQTLQMMYDRFNPPKQP